MRGMPEQRVQKARRRLHRIGEKKMFDLLLALLIVAVVGTPIVIAFEEAKKEMDEDDEA